MDKIFEKLKSESDKAYIGKTFSSGSEKILVITPSLKLQGALTVLVELLEYYNEKDSAVYIISPEDGEYRDTLLSMGMAVIIRPYVICSDEYRGFLQNSFDKVFINSAACNFYAYYFLNTKTKVFWWLHESPTQLKTMMDNLLHMNLLSENFVVAGVTPLVKKGIKELFDKNIYCLPMPIKDVFDASKANENLSDKVTFFIPAAYTLIKGQDVLLKAILMLPKAYSERARFVFCGYKLPGQSSYYDQIKSIASKIENVMFLDELSKDEVYEWYSNSDCVIAPSRVDATPTTIVEALMFERLCIVSDATGMSGFISDCDNGFVFPSENAEELMKRILLVIENINELSPIRIAGRQIYEQYFAPDKVYAEYERIF